MGKLDAIFKAEVLRLSRRQTRPVVLPLKKQVAMLTRQVRGLSKQVAKMVKIATRLQSSTATTALPLPAGGEAVEGVRMSAGLIQKLRKRLGLTQLQLAALVSVSAAAVQSWEQGIARPAGANKAAIVALRKLGRRQVVALMQQKGIGRAGRKPRIGRPRASAKAAAVKKSTKSGKKRGRRAR